jgi:hypothetical protein
VCAKFIIGDGFGQSSELLMEITELIEIELAEKCSSTDECCCISKALLKSVPHYLWALHTLEVGSNVQRAGEQYGGGGLGLLGFPICIVDIKCLRFRFFSSDDVVCFHGHKNKGDGLDE